MADKVVYKANKNYSQFTVVADKVVHGEQKLQSTLQSSPQLKIYTTLLAAQQDRPKQPS